MAEETREDQGGTVDATPEEEDMEAGNTEIGATEPASTATEIRTTTEPERTVQTTETQEAVGTPEYRLEIGKMAAGTVAAMAEAPITAIRTPVEAETAVCNPDCG